ncbi:uncharacterized protein LOC123541472 isoform X2 [Mercenaria mercenaria]|uniref:uncharacterized protein LOC123541472 isoform X2 n=1 Tax=Mercenaria mercenaria TaxID=6596 RepID=UPI00234E9AD9|nr:uncharacterized protein LOC123541472 isoform X2 [Mercenaria mercenaria]
MATCDLEMLKDIPGYKIVLKAVLKGQIQQLVQQLADQTDEESVILTASVSDGTLSHLGSESGKGFLEDHEDIKTQFLGFCLKNRHKQWLEKNNHGGTTSVQTSSKEPDLPHLSLKQGVMLSRSSPRLRHAPYIVKRATSNKALNVKNNNSLNETSTVSKTPVTESPKAVSDNSIKFKVEILENKEESTNVGEIGKLGADQDVKTVKQSVAKREAFENRPQSQNEATFQNEAEKTWLDSDYESLPVSENSNKVIPEGLFVNSGFANLMGADKSDSENKTESDIDTYVTVKVEAISDSDTELEETSQSWVNPEHSMDMSFNPDTDALDSHDDTSMQHSQITDSCEMMQDDPDISIGQQQFMEWMQQKSKNEPKKRFGTRCRDETRQKLAGAVKQTGKSSERSNRTAAMVFRQFLIEKNEDINFEYIEKSKLAELLSDFYINARTKDGTMYKSKSLTHMRYSLNQYFKSPPHSRNFDILHDEEFAHANKVFKVALQEILASGKGGITHHPIISNSDLITLYSSNCLSTNTPSGLQNRVQMNIRLTFCCEVNEKMAKMTKSTFMFAIDSDGTQYVYMQAKSEDTDNVAKANEKALAQMKEDKEHPELCPVQNFKTYLSKLHPLSDKLWQYPVEYHSHRMDLWLVGQKLVLCCQRWQQSLG